jgi:hypothetical protein
MLFHGIAIADPANKNAGFNLQKIRNEQENSQTQNESMPHFVISEQDKLNNFQRFEYPSVKGFDTLKESTVPITTVLETEIGDKQFAFRNEKQADVEIPVLETGKNITDMNGEGYYDPGIHEKISESQFAPTNHNLTSTQKFGRPITDTPTLLSDPNSLAKQDHYIHANPSKSFQKRYYENNPWKDATSGRVVLFERAREATRLA